MTATLYTTENDRRRGDRKKNFVLERLEYPPKPPGRVPASRKVPRKRILSVADEKAVAAGCRWNGALAEHAVKFFPKFLKHSQGQWAGQPFELGDYHREHIVEPLFGWVRPDGRRRFTATYFEEPKKNGKSSVAAGIGLYGLLADGEDGAHCYSFGADSNQAKIVHNEAVFMVEWSGLENKVVYVNRTTGEIRYPATKSYYRASSSATRGKHGIKMHVGIFDELHEWYGRQLWEQLKYAGRSRAQPIRFVITNAGDDTESVCYEQRQKALRVLSGETDDDAFLCHVLHVPEDDARGEIESVAAGATTLPVARICNPMLDAIIGEETLVRDIRDAIETPSELPNLLRLTYGVWVSSCENPLLPSGSWDACASSEIRLEDFAGLPCAAALDLGEIRDPASLALVFREVRDNQSHYTPFVWSWIPRKTAANKANKYAASWLKWAGEPLARVNLTAGEVVDLDEIANTVRRLHEDYPIQALLFDPRGAEQLTQQICNGVTDPGGNLVIEGTGIERVAFQQSVANYAQPTREFETAVVERRVHHDGNPFLHWEANHVSYVADFDGNRKPVKPGGKDDPRKVDAIQAVVMAMAGSLEFVDTSSAYDKPGSGVVVF